MAGGLELNEPSQPEPFYNFMKIIPVRKHHRSVFQAHLSWRKKNQKRVSSKSTQDKKEKLENGLDLRCPEEGKIKSSIWL